MAEAVGTITVRLGPDRTTTILPGLGQVVVLTGPRGNWLVGLASDPECTEDKCDSNCDVDYLSSFPADKWVDVEDDIVPDAMRWCADPELDLPKVRFGVVAAV